MLNDNKNKGVNVKFMIDIDRTCFELFHSHVEILHKFLSYKIFYSFSKISAQYAQHNF